MTEKKSRTNLQEKVLSVQVNQTVMETNIDVKVICPLSGYKNT